MDYADISCDFSLISPQDISFSDIHTLDMIFRLSHSELKVAICFSND
jgi:hypothetical protein